MALASRAMRQYLIDYIRTKMAQKRDGTWERIGFEDNLIPGTTTVDLTRVLDIDRLLNRLAEEDQRKASVVEMRFFGGLEFPEIAEQLKVSLITVKRDWMFCRAWLFKALTEMEAV
jgi:RNA polymerase sigma factor (TIGR02999 family)